MGTMIELPEKVEFYIDALVDETGHSKEYFIEEILERLVEDIQDYYMAIQVLGRVERGESKTYSDEEIRKSLGMAD